jgi:uncharacterized protein
MALKEVKEFDISTDRFSSWLRVTRRAQITGEGVNVPCGECTACCTSSYFIHIKPDETETLDRIPKELLFPAPGLSKGNALLGYDKKGHCPMFIDHKCSIYDHRPLTCRNYDCRIFPATGLPVGDDKVFISKRTHRWKFDFPATQDHKEFSAVQAAAKFLGEHTDLFPAGYVPSNTTQQAVLAIKVYEVFLDSTNKYKNGEHTDLNQVIVEAVIEACKRFETGEKKRSRWSRS